MNGLGGDIFNAKKNETGAIVIALIAVVWCDPKIVNKPLPIARNKIHSLSIDSLGALTMTIKYVALIFMMPICLAPVAAQPVRATENQRVDQNALKTAILFGAASTKAAVDKSNVTIRRLYTQLDSSTKATRMALRRANLSDQERRRLEEALRDERKQQEDLLMQLTAKDAEYASSIRAYREGLTGLLADNDPRIISAFERYADGDIAALDDLQEVTRIIRKAREAGLKARNGADQRGVAQTFLDAKDKGQKTTSEALAAWQEAAQIDETDFFQWIYISRLQIEAGNLPGAQTAATKAVSVAADNRDRSVTLNTLGDIAVLQGRLDDARNAYEEGLELARALALSNPSSAQAKRGVSVSLVRLGDVAVSQGRLEDARKTFEELLGLARALALFNPSSAQAQRDVSVSLDRLGDVAVSQGRLDDARKALEEGLELRRALALSNPSSAEAKRDVNVSLDRLGDVAVSQGRLEDARKAFEEVLGLARALALSNPSSAVARHDVSVSLGRLGDVAVLEGRLDEARKAFEEGLGLRRALALSNPSSERFQRDVSVSLYNLGDVAVLQGRLDEARKAFEEGLGFLRALALSNPSSAAAKRDLIVSYMKLAQLPGGEANYREALATAEAMARYGILAPSDQPLLDALRSVVKSLDAPK